MKKLIVTAFASSCLSLGVFAQGSININATVANDPGVTLQGANAASTASATTYFTGTLSLQIWYLAGTSVPGNINNLINTTDGGQQAAANLVSDGFTEVSTTTPTGSTVGAVSGTVSGGTLSFSPSTIGLSSTVPTASTNVLAIVGTAVGGANAGWEGVLAFVNPTGGNPNQSGGLPPAALTGWGALNDNLVLDPTASPEPTTIAFAALGLGSFLIARRRK
jgi:hypothetical protein